MPLKDQRLVVQGMITNEKISCQVILSKTTQYNYIYNSANINYETGAIVVISDNMGNADTLTEKPSGKYNTHPNNFTGVLGRSYKIDINTKDGNHYRSTPEEMTIAPKIDSIYFTRDPNDRLKGSNAYRDNIYINWHGPIDSLYYFMRGVQYYWNNAWHDSIAWVSVFNNFSLDGKYLKTLAVSEYDGAYFYVKVNLYSLSKNNYDFWNLLYQQAYPNDDDDVNVTVPLVGNIFNINNPDDYAIGYFQVSATSSKEIYVDH